MTEKRMEQQYEIRNKHMLIVSGGLGVLAVGTVMWDEWRVRHENEQAMVAVMFAKKDLPAGKKLTDADVDVLAFPMKMIPADFSGDIIQDKDKNAALDLELNQDVAAGRLMRFSYTRGGAARQGSLLVPAVGYRIVGVAVKKETCPPD